jgi:hypothetical protein
LGPWRPSTALSGARCGRATPWAAGQEAVHCAPCRRWWSCGCARVRVLRVGHPSLLVCSLRR